MFNLFKKSQPQTKLAPNTTVSTVSARIQSTNALIDEIHDTFYSEVDKLLEQARVTLSTETQKQALIEKHNKLVSLGFEQTKEFQEAQAELNRLRDIELMNLKNSEMVEAINYFSMKYPTYKFITEESVKRICEKYNLIYGSVKNYTGTVPDKNLEQMMRFTVSEEDKAYVHAIRYMMRGIGSDPRTEMMVSHSTYLTMLKTAQERRNEYSSYGFSESVLPCPLEIAAPQKDFNTQNMKVEGRKLAREIPDPIVLQPVLFNNKKHYLIVTAWGQEAADPDVLNERDN